VNPFGCTHVIPKEVRPLAKYAAVKAQYSAVVIGPVGIVAAAAGTKVAHSVPSPRNVSVANGCGQSAQAIEGAPGEGGLAGEESGGEGGEGSKGGEGGGRGVVSVAQMHLR